MSAGRSQTTFETLQIETSGQVAVVTLSRPESLNSLSAQMQREIAAAFADLDNNPAVRAVVITGTRRSDGRPCFCAGADLKDSNLEESVLLAKRAFTTVETLSKPVIAAIGGVAVGGGLELALVCDFRIAARDAKLGLPEINIGSMPRAGGTQRLAAIVGLGAAKELLFLGDLIDGSQAQAIGLVTRAVDPGNELSTALELAARLASKAPLALSAIKRSVREGRDLPLDEALDLEISLGACLDATDDRREGRQAFIEKRTPVYRGR